VTPSSHAHPGPEELDALLDPGGDARVGRHVRDCEQCRSVVDDLRRVRALLHAQVIDAEPPPEITAKILAALAAEPPLGSVGAARPDRPLFFDDAVPIFDAWDARRVDAVDGTGPSGCWPRRRVWR
jgi:hypothetical protein